MTIRALVGLLALNVGFAVAGAALMHAVRGFRTWLDVGRDLGLAYLVGVAAFGIVWTELLVVGVPFDGVGIVASLALLAVAGVAAARYRGLAPPRRGAWTLGGPIALVSAAGIAAAGLVFEALFRSARLQSLQAYDAWAFWVPKAKAIYFFGDLDEQVFTSAPGPSYPPLLPILDAASFHAMGSADVVTLHVQFWFLALGGAAAIAACLRGYAPAWLLWPSLILVLVVPRFGGRLLLPQADILVDLLFVTAALLVASWVREGAAWRLGIAALLLAACGVTKREGLVFAACVIGAALVASVGRRRRGWLHLGGVAVLVLAAAIPWRLWYSSRDIPSDTPSTGGTSAGRLWDAVDLSFEVLYSNALWSVVPVVATIAMLATLVWGDRRLALFLGAVLVLAFLGGAWATFGYPELPITSDEAVNPIVRYTGALVLLAGAATPLLLASVWRGERSA